MSDELLIETRGAALWLTINREARRNAISPAVVEGLAREIAEADRARLHRAIVITGAGSKAFCAGADLQAANGFGFDYSEPRPAFARLLRQAKSSTIPLVARVNGACMAGGMGLLSMCDLAVASDTAVFGLPEVKVGVFPAQVMSVLQHLIPRRIIAEMCLTGEPISAAEAKAAGLVNHVASDLDGAVQRLVDRLAANSPAAIRRGLYTMKAIEAMSFEASIAFTESQIALLAMTDDAKEGRAAFQEKRQPNWSGK